MPEDLLLMSADPPLAIDLRGVTKRFGKATAVDNLSLSVPQGSTFGLLGKNGAGKTTTIKMLMGLTRIDHGNAFVLGTDVRKHPTEKRIHIGYVPEIHNIYRWMTVEEVIWFTRYFYPNWNKALCQRTLELFELPTKKKVRHLSRGMLAKLSLLLAVSHEPLLLVLDEPMTGLDPVVREEFLGGVLASVCRSGRTVLFSSHTIDDVQRLADEVGILFNGKLLVRRRLSELLEARCLHVKLRDLTAPRISPANVIGQVIIGDTWLITVEKATVELLTDVRENNSVESIDVVKCSLEDIFKSYVKAAG